MDFDDPLRKPARRRPLTDRERAYYRFFHDAAMEFEWELRHAVWQGLILPGAWHDVLKDPGVKPKTRPA